MNMACFGKDLLISIEREWLGHRDPQICYDMVALFPFQSEVLRYRHPGTVLIRLTESPNHFVLAHSFTNPVSLFSLEVALPVLCLKFAATSIV